MDGFRPVGAFEPYRDAYFGWMASQGYKLPENREDIWLPEGDTPQGEQGTGATARPSRIPKELSDSAWFTERGLSYLRGRAGKPWFLHLGYYRPHPPYIAPAPYHAMYRPEDMPKVVRAASAEEEARQHPLLDYYVNNINQSSFFQDGKALGSAMSEQQVAQMRATYCGLMSESRRPARPRLRLPEADRPVGQHADRLHLRSRRAAGRSSPAGQDRLRRRILPHPDDRPRSAAGGQRHARLDRRALHRDDRHHADHLLEWLGLPIPRQCDGRSLLGFCDGQPPTDWRTEVHYEFDFRDLYYSKPESALGVPMDKCSLAVVQDENFKYVHFAALPPLLFDLRKDPGQFVNRAGDPAYAARLAEYSAKMLDWRLGFADRTLTGYRATPNGLEVRAA